MILDSGVVITLLLGGLDPEVLDDELVAPHLIDSEVTHVLRRMVFRGDISERQGRMAIDSFMAMVFTRRGVGHLRLRMWELRHNLIGYDSTYVALAEHLGAVLITTDRKLAKAPGIRCPVRVVG